MLYGKYFIKLSKNYLTNILSCAIIQIQRKQKQTQNEKEI